LSVTIFQLLLVAICHEFSAHLMATIEDASMPDALVIEIIDFFECALEWLQANRQKFGGYGKEKTKHVQP